MLKLSKIKMLTVLGLLLLGFVLPGNAAATDLDIFGISSQEVQPNVLIILDISGSMNTKDATKVNGGTDTRLNVAKKALTDLIKANPTVRWGLMVFPITVSGKVNGSGRLVEECKTWPDVQTLINKINGLSANGGTPVSSALAEAGRYYSGQKSFFWTPGYQTPRTQMSQQTYQYTSPIENECQNNYIILVTDGFSSVDSGIIGHNYYSTDSAAKWNFGTRNDMIYFMDDYLPSIPGVRPAIKIDGNKDANTNSGSYGYITWKTSHAGSHSEDLGSKLAPYTFDFWWTAAMNDRLSRNARAYDSSYYSLLSPVWSNIDAGGVDASWNTVFGTGKYLKAANINQLVSRGIPYKYGYNAADPSRPVPPLPVYNGRDIYTNQQGYIHPTQIYQGNLWESGMFASDYMDDVAAILQNEDLRPGLGDVGSKYEKQTVKTFVIGFRFSGDLLERTAVMGGTGKDGYFTANNASELTTSLSQIVTSMKQEMSVYASPSVPSSSENSHSVGDYLYMGLFKPQEKGFWLGNVKKYELDADKTMKPHLNPDDTIKSTAHSEWTTGGADGADITKGGAAQQINAMVAAMKGQPDTEAMRNVYTYVYAAGAATNDLTAARNKILEKNTVITSAMLGLGSVSEVDRKAAITKIRETPFGAVIHSSPTVANYADSSRVVFVGAQDGFLHAIDDNNGKELWAFVMPDHLATIKSAATSTPNDGVWYVDGNISIRNIDSTKVMVFGARRGGQSYVALDITNKNKPLFMYQVPSLNGDDPLRSLMGLSWASPTYIRTHKGLDKYDPYDDTSLGLITATVSTSSGSVSNNCISEYKKFNFEENSITHNVIIDNLVIFPGGYDTRYDTILPHDFPKNAHDEYIPAVGAAIVGVDPLTGAKSPLFAKLNSSKSDLMIHSIVDVVAADMNIDNMVDSLYFGDMGGNVFMAIPYSMSVSDDTCKTEFGGVQKTFTPQAEFEPYKLFETREKDDSNGKWEYTSGRVFMYAPDVVRENGIEFLYLGSGNRETPLDKVVQNRFYCIKNIARSNLTSNTSSDFYMTDKDLLDISANLAQSKDNDIKKNAEQAAYNSRGWFFDLNPGEKVTSRAMVLYGTVFFLTYEPIYDEMPDPTDLCKGGSSQGESRLYAINYLTGAGDERYVPSGERSMSVGDSMTGAFAHGTNDDGSSKLYLLYTENGEQKEKEIDVLGSADREVFFWREVF